MTPKRTKTNSLLIDYLIEGSQSLHHTLKEMARAVKTGVRVPYDAAKLIADEIVAKLTPLCSRVEIAGSLRRKKSDVGDIDIVLDLLPGVSGAGLRDAMRKLDPSVSGGDLQIYFTYKDVVVNLYVKADNMPFEALLMRATGPFRSNIGLSAKAKAQGWTLSQYGLRDKDGTLLSGTERGIRDALGVKWKKPEER